MNLKQLKDTKQAVGALYMNLDRDTHFNQVVASHSNSLRYVAKTPIAKKLGDAYTQMAVEEFKIEKGK